MRFALIAVSALAASPHSAVGVPRAPPTPLLDALELRGGGIVPADVHSPLPFSTHARITALIIGAHRSPVCHSHTMLGHTDRSRRLCTRCPSPSDLSLPRLQTYTKASAIIYALHALQFLAIPETFISYNFDVTPDAMHVFIARGSGLTCAGVAYAVHKFDVPLKLLVAYNAMIGLVYPWNAAYISKLPVKYPMHYLSQVLTAGLTLAGVLAL